MSDQPENHIETKEEIDQLNLELENDESDELMFELAEGVALQEALGSREDGSAELPFADDILENNSENSILEKIYGLPIPEIEELLRLQQAAQARAFKIVRHLRAAEDRILEVKRDRRAAVSELKNVQRVLVQLQNELVAAQDRENLLEQQERHAVERAKLAERLVAEAKIREESSKLERMELEKNWSRKQQEMQLIADEKNSLLSLTSMHEKKLAEQAESLAQQTELLENSRRKLLEYQRNRDELVSFRDKIQQQNQEIEQLRAANESLTNESKELSTRIESAREEREELLKLMRTAMERLERRRGDSQVKKNPPARN